jgi:hypothetical protein
MTPIVIFIVHLYLFYVVVVVVVVVVVYLFVSKLVFFLSISLFRSLVMCRVPSLLF